MLLPAHTRVSLHTHICTHVAFSYIWNETVHTLSILFTFQLPIYKETMNEEVFPRPSHTSIQDLQSTLLEIRHKGSWRRAVYLSTQAPGEVTQACAEGPWWTVITTGRCKSCYKGRHKMHGGRRNWFWTKPSGRLGHSVSSSQAGGHQWEVHWCLLHRHEIPRSRHGTLSCHRRQPQTAHILATHHI